MMVKSRSTFQKLIIEHFIHKWAQLKGQNL